MVKQFILLLIIGCSLVYAVVGCRSTKKLQTAVNKKDTLITVNPATINIDSVKGAELVLSDLAKNRINFTTF
ncbi:MAG: hypothetical protein ABIO76_06850, partial [Ginsengibacter sp.]